MFEVKGSSKGPPPKLCIRAGRKTLSLLLLDNILSLNSNTFGRQQKLSFRTEINTMKHLLTYLLKEVDCDALG